MPLMIHLRERQLGRYELALEGRLDTETSPQLDHILENLYNCPVRALTLNMARLDYISSAGIRSVLVALKRIRSMGGQFAMVELQAPVQKIFDIVQVLPSENLFVSMAEADRYFDAIQRQEREKEKYS